MNGRRLLAEWRTTLSQTQDGISPSMSHPHLAEGLVATSQAAARGWWPPAPMEATRSMEEILKCTLQTSIDLHSPVQNIGRRCSHCHPLRRKGSSSASAPQLAQGSAPRLLRHAMLPAQPAQAKGTLRSDSCHLVSSLTNGTSSSNSKMQLGSERHQCNGKSQKGDIRAERPVLARAPARTAGKTLLRAARSQVATKKRGRILATVHAQARGQLVRQLPVRKAEGLSEQALTMSGARQQDR